MMDIATAARAMEGRMLGENVRFSGVATDTRVLGEGDLFVALKGERFDGHEFVGLARERGAVAAIVGCAIAASSAVSPGWFMPTSMTATAWFSRRPRIVRGSPMALLKLPRVASA